MLLFCSVFLPLAFDLQHFNYAWPRCDVTWRDWPATHRVTPHYIWRLLNINMTRCMPTPLTHVIQRPRLHTTASPGTPPLRMRPHVGWRHSCRWERFRSIRTFGRRRRSECCRCMSSSFTIYARLQSVFYLQLKFTAIAAVFSASTKNQGKNWCWFVKSKLCTFYSHSFRCCKQRNRAHSHNKINL